MYFPIGWPKYLEPAASDTSDLVYVVSNRDRVIFAVVTLNSISLWYCKPTVQIATIRRSDNSVSEFGVNHLAEWRPDSSMLAVTTSRGYIIFYKLELDMAGSACQCIYMQKEARHSSKKETSDLSISEGIPALRLVQSSYIQVPGGIKSFVCIRDELMVATGIGHLKRIKWDGIINGQLGIQLRAIPFSLDLQHSRASPMEEPNVCFIQIEFSPLLGGFAVVLSNGKAAFITSMSQKFEPSQIQGVWAQDLNNANCVAINHKYRLIAFGCKNSEGVVYAIDEITGALQVSHRLNISSKDYPEAGQAVGSVRLMKWTPDGCALAMAWEKGGFSLWSVFGALLVCTLSENYGASLDACRHQRLHISSMEWGAEGYHLWLVCNSHKEYTHSEGEHHHPRELLLMQYVKSALTVNPCMNNHEHLFLQGEDKLYLNISDSQLTSGQRPLVDGWDSAHGPGVLLGNKFWQIIPLPQNYLQTNWPIRYAAIDRAGHCVAIAGKTGLAHYALFSKKWKLFGNETQSIKKYLQRHRGKEKDLVVCGGLTWWRDFICIACYNLLDQRDEIRFYPRSTKLDNTFAHITKIPSQVLLLNTFRDIVIVLCGDCHIMMYHVTRKNGQSANPTVEVTKMQEVAIGSFIPHPASIVGITLTSLRTEGAAMKTLPQAKEAESILMNVAGKLLMFQRDRSGPPIQQREGKHRPLPFCAPMMVASAVENMWSTARSNSGKKHLMEALWLSCGAQGMKVWLPLFPRGEVKTHGFMSKRIMLPFHVDIYPLAVLFECAVILGVGNDTMSYTVTSSTDVDLQLLPYSMLERTSQIYLHHILRQLLRRNLGVHALEIARCCTDLPYFPHVLELLLHIVLEEEATSKDPIPDPLLPRVVAFIQEFPEYLQTVVHCARKTEVALWSYLFSTVGNPRELFSECLKSEQLDTAASYLLILQNLEKPLISRQHATLLLDRSLENRKWELVRDLVRFLKAIDPSDAESPPHALLTRPASGSLYPFPNQMSPPLAPQQQDSTVFPYGNASSRVRSMSVERFPEISPDSAKSGSRERTRTTSGSQERTRKQSPGIKEEPSADQVYIDTILQRHARKLLCTYRLRDLGRFAANLEDYHLVMWLKKEKLRAGKVEDFVSALKQLHDDFMWPFPFMSYNTFVQLQRASSAASTPLSPSQPIPGAAQAVNGQAAEVDNGPLLSLDDLDLQDTPPDLLAGHLSDNIMLKPQPSREVSRDDVSHATTEQSDNSSATGDTDFPADTNSWSDTASLSELEQISLELANKGPQQSEIELRYMLQILLEAGCLELALLVAIVLRDAMAVVRTVNTASMTDTPIEVTGRMREGLSFLELWAETECLGYKPFLQAIRGQTQVLDRVVEQNPPKSRLSTSSLDNASIPEEEPSQSSGHNSEVGEEILPVPVEKAEEESYECIIQ